MRAGELRALVPRVRIRLDREDDNRHGDCEEYVLMADYAGLTYLERTWVGYNRDAPAETVATVRRVAVLRAMRGMLMEMLHQVEHPPSTVKPASCYAGGENDE